MKVVVPQKQNTTTVYAAPGSTVVVKDVKGKVRDVDEYNRRYTSRDNNFSMENDTLYIEEKPLNERGEWVNGFEGSQDDYEYAMRIVRFRNPRYAIPVSSPLYWDVVYGLPSWDWNVYDDGLYAYVFPTYTNRLWWDWRWNYPYGASWGFSWGWSSPWYYNSWYYPGYWGGGYWGGYWGYHHHHHHHHDEDEHDHEHCCHHDHDEDEHDHEHCCHHDHDEDDHDHEHCCHHDHDEHDHHHEHHYDEHGVCSCGHHHDHDADEVFTSWGKETAHKYSREDLDKALHALDEGAYGMILRAKGIVDGGDTWYEFDMVPGEHEIRTCGPDVTGKLCVIGSELKEHEIAELFHV